MSSLEEKYGQYKVVDDVASKPHSTVAEFLNDVLPLKYNLSAKFIEKELAETHESVRKLYILRALYIVKKNNVHQSRLPNNRVSDWSIDNFLRSLSDRKVHEVAVQRINQEEGRGRSSSDYYCQCDYFDCYHARRKVATKAFKEREARRAAADADAEDDEEPEEPKYTDDKLQAAAISYAKSRIARHERYSQRRDPTYLAKYGTLYEIEPIVKKYLARRPK